MRIGLLAAAVAAAALAGCGSSGNATVPAARDAPGSAPSTGRTVTSGSAGLLYRGGPVQTAPKIYVVFWGSGWAGGSGDPDGVKTYLTNFYGVIGGSPWLATLTQYGVGNSGNILGGTYVDTSSAPPLHPTQAQLAAEAARDAAHFGAKGLTIGDYVVALPHGIVPAGFGTQYCAYHSTTTSGGTTIAWTNLPYVPDAGTACGAGAVHSPGTLDGVSIVAGGEQAEVETNPDGSSGWTDSSGAEVADKCGFGIGYDSVGGYPVPKLWSNAAGRCV